MEKIVVALGGNALQTKDSRPDAESQLKVVKDTCRYLARLAKMGYEMAIVHGNGPQVGRIVLAFESARDVTPPMPFDVCGAMSQGYIGYHIQSALSGALSEEGMSIPTATVVTEVVVDENDRAFINPTKPIGAFYTKEEAEKLENESGFTMREDAGRGFRRAVASPKPLEIVELDCIKSLLDTSIVICCGGGGIPVVRAGNSLTGVEAVIDKDFAAELLAEKIGADTLLILTEVEKVAINFGKPDQKNLSSLTVSEAEKYILEGQFAPGSMLPKVEAAMKFVSFGENKKAIITGLANCVEALQGKTGTLIEK